MKFIKDNEKMEKLMMISKLTNYHEIYIEKMEKSILYSICIDNIDVGHIVLSTKPHIYISILMIKDKYKRKGYGTQVVNFFKKMKGEIYIHCDLDDYEAYSFWIKMGFKRNNKDNIIISSTELNISLKWEI